MCSMPGREFEATQRLLRNVRKLRQRAVLPAVHVAQCGVGLAQECNLSVGVGLKCGDVRAVFGNQRRDLAVERCAADRAGAAERVAHEQRAICLPVRPTEVRAKVAVGVHSVGCKVVEMAVDVVQRGELLARHIQREHEQVPVAGLGGVVRVGDHRDMRAVLRHFRAGHDAVPVGELVRCAVQQSKKRIRAPVRAARFVRRGGEHHASAVWQPIEIFDVARMRGHGMRLAARKVEQPELLWLVVAHAGTGQAIGFVAQPFDHAWCAVLQRGVLVIASG